MKKIFILLLLFVTIFTVSWAADVRRIKLVVTGPFENEVRPKIYETTPDKFVWCDNDYLKNMTIHVNCRATRTFNNNSSSYGRNGGGGFSYSGTELYFDVVAVDNEGNRYIIASKFGGCYQNYSESSNIQIGAYNSQSNTQISLNIDRLIKILKTWDPPYSPPIICIAISEDFYQKYQTYCKKNTMWHVKRNNVIIATCPLLEFYPMQGKWVVYFRPKLHEVNQKLYNSTEGIDLVPVGIE